MYGCSYFLVSGRSCFADQGRRLVCGRCYRHCTPLSHSRAADRRYRCLDRSTLPEVMVSATSAVSGHGEIAYGNAVGSIICNTALIAAITVAVRPAKIERSSLGLPVVFFFIAAAFYTTVAYAAGFFGYAVGAVLLAMFVAYIALSVRQTLRTPQPAGAAEQAATPASKKALVKEILLLIVGAALIAIGARFARNGEGWLVG